MESVITGSNGRKPVRLSNLFIELFLFSILVTGAIAQQSGWVLLEPHVIKLQGRLLRVMKYGPPNYGELPESDAKYEIPIILLDQPIRVRGDPTSPVNKEDMKNVSFVQLIFHDTPANKYWRYANQDVVVSGTLFRAQTAHHYTPLVMEVKAIMNTAKKGR